MNPIKKSHSQNIAAEQETLGGVLLDGARGDNEMVVKVREIFGASNPFYEERHRKIWVSMIRIAELGKPADIVTVSEQLESEGQLEGIGGHSYLMYLTETATSAVNAPYHAQIVMEKARERKLSNALLSLHRQLDRGEIAADEAINENLSLLDGLTSARRVEKLEVPRPSLLAEEAFHGLAGDIVKAIEPHSEADPAALLITLLTCFGNTIGNRPHFRVEADKHRLTLFPVFVGPTSKGRKGVSFGHIRQVFETVDPEFSSRVHSGLSSGEGLIWAVRDPVTKKRAIKEGRKVVGYEDELVDGGVDDKRLLVLESEFASTLKVMSREGNILSPTIRNAWDHNGDLQTLTKNSPTKATGSHISIIAHITGEELRRYLNSTETANGFGNRFLFVWVERSKVLPFGGELDIAKHSELTQRLGKAIDSAKDTNRITWARETRDLWASIYPSLSEGKPGIVGLLTARAEAYVSRIACIYALLDKSNEIRPEHLEAALAVWDYVEASTRYIFNEMTGNPLADVVYEALLAKPEGISRTEINNLSGRHKSSEEISSALNLLKSLGIATMLEVQTEGRPREIWRACVANENKSTGCELCEKSEKSSSVGGAKGT